ncbi:PLD nuclease N-terminal domain-containing protein [Dictyobacter halimunensis]
MRDLIGVLVMVVPMLIWFGALWHCFRNRALGGGAKLLWLLFIFFTHIFGAIIYWIFAPKRNALIRMRTTRAYQQPPRQYYYPSNRQQQYYQPPRAPEPYYQPSEPEQTRPEEYRPYQQGYARRADPPTEQEPIQASEYSSYEYPQATYPEQTQQQQ